jgi:hypothetical protein
MGCRNKLTLTLFFLKYLQLFSDDDELNFVIFIYWWGKYQALLLLLFLLFSAIDIKSYVYTQQ